MDTGLNVILPMLAFAGSASMMAATMTTAESAFAVAGAAGMYMKGNGQKNDDSKTASRAISPETRSISLEIAQHVIHIKQYVMEKSIQPYFTDKDKKIDWVTLSKDGSKLKVACEELEKYEQELYVQQKNPAVDAQYAKEVALLLSDFKEFVEELASKAEKSEANTAVGDLPKNFKEFKNQFFKLGDAKKAVLSTTTAEPSSSPGMVKQAVNKMTTTKSQVSDNFAKAMFTKLELTKEQLRSTEKRANELREEDLKRREQLRQVLKEVAEFEERNATKKKILDMIGKGLDALYQLRDQWVHLSLFFQRIETLLTATVGPQLTQFSELSAEAAKITVEEKERISTLTRGRLYQLTRSDVDTTGVVLYLSSCYVELSKDHLIPIINEFGPLMSMNRSAVEDSGGAATFQLMNKTWAAEDAIAAIVDKGHRELLTDVEERMKEIETVKTVYVNNLPAVSKEERNEIAADVKDDEQDQGGRDAIAAIVHKSHKELVTDVQERMKDIETVYVNNLPAVSKEERNEIAADVKVAIHFNRGKVDQSEF